ncbi:hypothetical protein AAMO2058_000004500 [Amorphochlora amoebiformis]
MHKSTWIHTKPALNKCDLPLTDIFSRLLELEMETRDRTQLQMDTRDRKQLQMETRDRKQLLRLLMTPNPICGPL